MIITQYTSICHNFLLWFISPALPCPTAPRYTAPSHAPNNWLVGTNPALHHGTEPSHTIPDPNCLLVNPCLTLLGLTIPRQTTPDLTRPHPAEFYIHYLLTLPCRATPSRATPHQTSPRFNNFSDCSCVCTCLEPSTTEEWNAFDA